MLGFIERRIAYIGGLRATWRAQREARASFTATLRTSQIRLCPGCQVPIEKNEGCDHMHCTFCGLHFSWRQAVPYNMAALENTGDGRFRFCPHCNYQNEKLHCLGDARCTRCQKDFIWEAALFVPVVVMRTAPTGVNNNSRRPTDECGRTREAPPPVSAALREWLQDPRRPNVDGNANETEIPLDNEIHESLRCEICAVRQKTCALQCGHLFCEHCLVQVLRDHPLCPIDRSVVASPPIRIYF
jgi:hypothetical protein